LDMQTESYGFSKKNLIQLSNFKKTRIWLSKATGGMLEKMKRQ